MSQRSQSNHEMEIDATNINFNNTSQQQNSNFGEEEISVSRLEKPKVTDPDKEIA